MFVADEETGGDVGAHWLTSEHPDKVRCDMLFNEGGGESFEYDGRRHYGVCCAEKGIFRFNVTAHGAAGHASLPRTGDNALLKLGPDPRRGWLTSPSRSRSPTPRRRCCAASARTRPTPGPRWPGSPPPSRACARWSSRCSG